MLWSVADRAQERIQFRQLARVEARCRLVEAKQHRIGAHRPRDLEPSLRAVRQFAGRIIGPVGEPDLVQPVFRPVDRFGLLAAIARGADETKNGHAACPHQRIVVRDQQILERRHALEEADVLEGARHPRGACDLVVGHALEQEEVAVRGLRVAAARLGRRFDVLGGRDPVAREREPPFGRFVEAGDAVEDGRLAGAVRPDEGGDSPRPTAKLKAFTASRPPNRIVRFSTASSGLVSQFISRGPL